MLVLDGLAEFTAVAAGCVLRLALAGVALPRELWALAGPLAFWEGQVARRRRWLRPVVPCRCGCSASRRSGVALPAIGAPPGLGGLTRSLAGPLSPVSVLAGTGWEQHGAVAGFGLAEFRAGAGRS